MKFKDFMIYVGVGALVILVGLCMISPMMKILDKCEERGMTNCNPVNDGYEGIKCFDNCKELGKEYFRYDNGGFSSSECWCLKGNDPQQIW